MLQQISHYPSAGRLERGKAESPTNKRRQDARSARFSVAHKAARQRSVNRIRPRPAFTNTHLPVLIRVRDDAEDTKEPERQVISRAASVIRDAKAGIELPTARGGDEFSSPKNLRAGEYYISPNRSQASKKGRLEMLSPHPNRKLVVDTLSTTRLKMEEEQMGHEEANLRQGATITIQAHWRGTEARRGKRQPLSSCIQQSSAEQSAPHTVWELLTMEEECNLRQVFQVSEVDNYLTRREFKLASKAIIHRLLFARACDANDTRDAAASDAWLEAEFRELLARRPLHGRLSNSGSCIKIAHFCSWAANLALREVSDGNTSATESKNGEAPAASEPNHSMVKQQYQDALKQNRAVRRQAGRHPVASQNKPTEETTRRLLQERQRMRIPDEIAAATQIQTCWRGKLTRLHKQRKAFRFNMFMAPATPDIDDALPGLGDEETEGQPTFTAADEISEQFMQRWRISIARRLKSWKSTDVLSGPVPLDLSGYQLGNMGAQALRELLHQHHKEQQMLPKAARLAVDELNLSKCDLLGDPMINHSLRCDETSDGLELNARGGAQPRAIVDVAMFRLSTIPEHLQVETASAQQHAAASKIQANFRGILCRRNKFLIWVRLRFQDSDDVARAVKAANVIKSRFKSWIQARRNFHVVRENIHLAVESSSGVCGARMVAAIIAQYHASLQRVVLSDNQGLGPSGGQALASAFSCASHLMYLDMGNCHIRDSGACTLLRVLSEYCPMLQDLSLKGNCLGQNPTDTHLSMALTTMVEDGMGKLDRLNLADNFLNSMHIQALMRPLEDPNRNLRELDLSWNRLGDNGAMAFAEALRRNTGLVVVNISHNEIGERGAMVLADVLKENEYLRTVFLDQNPIGPRGCRALLRALRRLIEFGWHRDISVESCNVNVRSSAKLFDVQDPGGECDLSVMGARGVYECDLSDPYARMVAWELVELAWAQDGENWVDESLDGKKFDLEEPDPGVVWTRADYQLPRSGVLRLTFVTTLDRPKWNDVLENEMLEKLMCMMNLGKGVTTFGLQLLRLAAIDFFFAADQVGDLISLMRDSYSRVDACTALLSRVVDSMNISCCVFNLLSDLEFHMLETSLGPLFYMVPGNLTGHYELQLSVPEERAAVIRLACFGEQQKAERQLAKALDTSEKSDWENYRNEFLDGKPYNLETEDLSTGGIRSGKLQMDYVSTDCAHRACRKNPMDPGIFELFLLEINELRNIVKCVDQSSSSVHAPSRTRSKNVPLNKSQRRRRSVVAISASLTLRGCGGKGWGTDDTIPNPGLIHIDVLRGSSLVAMDRRGTSDPYVVVKLPKADEANRETYHDMSALYPHEHRTTTSRRTLDPRWSKNDRRRATFYLLDALNTGTIQFQCFDWDEKGKDDPMGAAQLDMNRLLTNGETHELVLSLADTGSGSLYIRVWVWKPKLSKVQAARILQRLVRAKRLRHTMKINAEGRKKLREGREEMMTVSAGRMEQMHLERWRCSGRDVARTGKNDGRGAKTTRSSKYGANTTHSVQEERVVQEIRIRLRIQKTKSLSRAARACWNIPRQNAAYNARTMAQREEEINRRVLRMLRLATIEFFFSSEQVLTIMATIRSPANPVPCKIDRALQSKNASQRRTDYSQYLDRELRQLRPKDQVCDSHVEALVTLFSRITDIEKTRFDYLLGHQQFDDDGNHFVSEEELEALRGTPYLVLLYRLGAANLFNPLRPDGEYALDLRAADQRLVAQLLVILSSEPGENLQYETYNGYPFQVGKKWETEVPDLGIFCCTYITPTGCASLALRCTLANRLLLLGRGRWRCMPDHHICEADRPGPDGVTEWERSNVTAADEICLDVDGSLCERRLHSMAITTALHSKAQASLDKSLSVQWKTNEFARKLLETRKHRTAKAQSTQVQVLVLTRRLVFATGKVVIMSRGGSAAQRKATELANKLESEETLRTAVRFGLTQNRGSDSGATEAPVPAPTVKEDGTTETVGALATKNAPKAHISLETDSGGLMSVLETTAQMSATMKSAVSLKLRALRTMFTGAGAITV